MSRHFTSSSSTLSTSAVQVNTPPFMISLWFLPDTLQSSAILFTCDDGTITNAHQLEVTGATSKLDCHSHSASANSDAVTTNGARQGVWNHAFGLWNSTSNRHSVLNGVVSGLGNDSTTVTPSGLSGTQIGDNAAGSFFNGAIAEVVVWSTSNSNYRGLAQDLYNGRNPFSFFPNKIVAYWPLFGYTSPELDYSSVLNLPNTVHNPLTPSGCPQSNHPWFLPYLRRRRRFEMLFSSVSVAGAPKFIPEQLAYNPMTGMY